MKSDFSHWLMVAAASLLLAACSTPATRIRENAALFESLPSPSQDLIRQGKVDVGFTPEMVRLALGAPEKVYTRTNASGVREAWLYTDWAANSGYVYYAGIHPRRFPAADAIWIESVDRRESERIKVVFKDGRVEAIEESRWMH